MVYSTTIEMVQAYSNALCIKINKVVVGFIYNINNDIDYWNIIKVPSHIGIIGNEIADCVASAYKDDEWLRKARKWIRKLEKQIFPIKCKIVRTILPF